MIVETQNLTLIACDPALLTSALQGNDALSKKINAAVPDNWTEFGPAALQYSLDRLKDNDGEKNWWTYFPIHKKDKTLIGSGGYKGKPSPEGVVEIGYEIAPLYRQRGMATEFTKGLIGHAFTDARVRSIIAHTLGEINPSTKVLQKCGFEKTEEINDLEEGVIWKWELVKK